MSLPIDGPAPNFKLFNTQKEEVELNQLLGKNVVLLFFPLAFTGTCTKELCSIRDSYKIYEDFNATVFGISVDTPHTLLKFKEEQNLNFELLSDFNKTVSARYDTLYDTFILGMKGVSKRSAFVINKDGVLKYAEVLDNASDLPNFDKIKLLLETLT